MQTLQTSEDPRFIPTCVGNSTLRDISPGSSAVHPHMCGEFPRHGKSTLISHGSSPHVWGIPCLEYKRPVSLRFIPTCVGNSYPCIQLYPGASVHPHMCGEFALPLCSWATSGGSSPHVWGIPGRKQHGHRIGRFIPTCVGNSFVP